MPLVLGGKFVEFLLILSYFTFLFWYACRMYYFVDFLVLLLE